jgi:predicted Zn-dependent protease with MMP-like domain
MMASTNPVVSMRLGSEYTDKLTSHDLFIKHTILHEIGHTKGLSEEESDSFAFNEINKEGET